MPRRCLPTTDEDFARMLREERDRLATLRARLKHANPDNPREVVAAGEAARHIEAALYWLDEWQETRAAQGGDDGR